MHSDTSAGSICKDGNVSAHEMGDEPRETRTNRLFWLFRDFNGEHMTHPSLLNPFSPNQQSGILFGRQGGRATPVCTHCQSDDIISHATAQWSNESQQWELANTFAQPAHCNRCNSLCDIIWLPLN
jgi:hypothetical protein